MAFVWKPAIYKPIGATTYFLPKPINMLKVGSGWDARESKIPLKDGETFTGHTLNSAKISIQGQFGKDAGGFLLSEEDMWTAWEELREAVNIDSDTNKYEFFIYHDGGSSTYRKLKLCCPVSCELQFGDEDCHLFGYQVEIRAEDPVIYSTGPGA
jgi:hypothetical protein